MKNYKEENAAIVKELATAHGVPAKELLDVMTQKINNFDMMEPEMVRGWAMELIQAKILAVGPQEIEDVPAKKEESVSPGYLPLGFPYKEPKCPPGHKFNSDTRQCVPMEESKAKQFSSLLDSLDESEKISDKEVKAKVQALLQKWSYDSLSFIKALTGLWFSYNFTDKQRKYIDQVKKEGSSSLLDEAIPSKQHIFDLLDRIEDKKKKMIHEIPELADKMKDWQDGKLKDSFFKETLNKYWDKLQEE